MSSTTEETKDFNEKLKGTEAGTAARHAARKTWDRLKIVVGAKVTEYVQKAKSMWDFMGGLAHDEGYIKAAAQDFKQGKLDVATEEAKKEILADEEKLAEARGRGLLVSACICSFLSRNWNCRRRILPQ